MIRVLIVDDRASIRRGLRMCFAVEPDITVVGEAEDGAEALNLAEAVQPDVVLVDVVMPSGDGIAAIAALRAVSAESAVIVHTIRDDPATRARALAAGADAFISKGRCSDGLVPTIRQVAARRLSVSR